MQRRIRVFILALWTSGAHADPVRTDPSPEVTVFTEADGANVVTLVHNPPPFKGDRLLGLFHDARYDKPLRVAMNEKQDGKTKMRNVGNSVFGLGYKSYWVRTRFVDGRLICEKFAQRPDDAAQIEALGKALLAQSCKGS